MAAAESLLLALAEGRDTEAWEFAQALAKAVLDDPRHVLARSVLDGGPFAMRKAEELAELVLSDVQDEERRRRSTPSPASGLDAEQGAMNGTAPSTRSSKPI